MSEDTALMFVNRYRIDHIKRRKVLRKLLHEGKATVEATNKDGWLYRVPAHIKTRKM